MAYYIRGYWASLEWHSDLGGGLYVATIQELPGLVGQGRTRSEVFRALAQAIDDRYGSNHLGPVLSDPPSQAVN